MKTAVLWLVVAVTCLGVAQADVIYSDDFSGSAATDLNGTAPDTGLGVVTWSASTLWKADGSKTATGSGSAFLPFTPTAGNRFTLSADVDPVSGGSDWFALGFSAGAATNGWHTVGNAMAGWMLNRADDASGSVVQTFAGPETANGASHDFNPDKVGPVNLKVVLDTQPANWTVQWFVDNVSIRVPFAYVTNPTINYVGLGANSNATGTADNYVLTSDFAYTPPPLLFQATQNTNTGFTVSSTDLLEGLIPIVVGNINAEEGRTTTNPAALTNGAFGAPNAPNSGPNINEVVAIHNGVELTYILGDSPVGYDISEINSFSGWNDPGRDAQQFSILYSTYDDPDNFLTLATVNYNPGGAPSPSDLGVFLSDAFGGYLAEGVAKIRFSFPTTENGFVGYREFDVIGVSALVIPEPATVSLLALGGLGLLWRRRRAGRSAHARLPMVLLVLLACGLLVGAPQATAGVFTFSPFTGDADSGISSSKTYTHAVDYNGPGRTVNGVNFIAGARTGADYILAGAGNGFTGNGNTAVGDTNFILRNFYYGPGASLSLTGLTPGYTYTTTLYNETWEAAGSRWVNIVASDGGSILFDEDFSNTGGGDNPNLLQYTFTAIAPSITYSFSPVNAGNTFHQYAFSNELVSVGAPPLGIPIPGMFNTGVDDSGNPLPNNSGAIDPHYRIVSAPGSLGPDAHVEDQSVSPIVECNWVANSLTSKWIAPQFNTSAAPSGRYEYEIEFDLTGLDPDAAVIVGLWATDNQGVDILINGNSTGQFNTAGFSTFTSFLINGGFVPGVNTLTFVVQNTADGYTALRVEGLQAYVTQVIPEPATLSLLALGGLGLLRRRTRTLNGSR